MQRDYIRSHKLFEVGNLYGHHILGLASVVYSPNAKVGAGPDRIDVRVVIDGNIADDMSFIISLEHLNPFGDKSLPESSGQLELPVGLTD